MTQITFLNYDPSNRDPGTFVEVDNTSPNPGRQLQRTLIFGQILAAGTYPPNVPVLATSLGDAQLGCGRGSMLLRMYQRYRTNDKFGTVYLMPVADNGAGAAATGTVTITGPATAAGTLSLYVGGQVIETGVNVGDTATVVAANVVIAAGLMPDLPVTIAAVAGVLTLTARHKGLMGNNIDVRMNYEGIADGEVTPAGLAVAIVAMSGGTTNPTLTNALAALTGDTTYDFIVWPWTDATNLNAIQLFLSDASGRWNWTQQLFGGAFSALRGNLSALVTAGSARNDRHMSILGFYDSPTMDDEVAADYASACAVQIRANPAVPLATLSLTMLAPPKPSRFDSGERNTLLYAGISPIKVDDSDTVHIGRSITTYQFTATGSPDDTFLNTERMYTVQACLRDLIAYISGTYNQKILLPDGTRINFGTQATTAQLMKAAVAARYQLWCDNALMENPDAFSAALTAQNMGGGLVGFAAPLQTSGQLFQEAFQVTLLPS